ncbi:interferon regulatory factor 4-like isoform X1 [Corythoichthys intestinalis]|uniref:interferon regulatory factor 4-like isoform X1 n=2 Tax=Corythoichthys intestinalis TaxID=161448 RepID=UPI0025A5008B|nr:interferon regulatory factor 4-like isoform X1 [Corythoichthys intestinalis]XP_057680331.1 interferon regulatory factor 4-like isoform X1 [Corythoichthys intestinalis]
MTRRRTRKLRAWIVEQVSSGKYAGLTWEDESKTMFRIPWKHAGKQDFRKDEDAAIFKAWAEFKGKMDDNNPAAWKTRLRCALNKSSEFTEVVERAQMDISEPYKVYRLVPLNEQNAETFDSKRGKKRGRKWKRRSSDEEDVVHAKEIKTDDDEVEPCAEEVVATQNILPQLVQTDDDLQLAPLREIRLDVRIEESCTPPPEDSDSLLVSVHYLGQQVLTCLIHGPNVRILYAPSSSPMPPTPAPDAVFPRIYLPPPPPSEDAERTLLFLLHYMEKGVVLTSTPRGVYGKRFCQGRVFWTGPHVADSGLHKMERDSGPVLLFSKDAFKQELENFRVNGGEPPQCSLTLCFGEELSSSEDPSKKFIIVLVTLPWAQEQVESSRSILDSFDFLQSPPDEITLNLVAVPAEEETP